MQNLIQEILKENNKAFLPRLNETQPVEVLFDFELITIREVVSLHTPVKKKNCDVKTDYYRVFTRLSKNQNRSNDYRAWQSQAKANHHFQPMNR